MKAQYGKLSIEVIQPSYDDGGFKRLRLTSSFGESQDLFLHRDPMPILDEFIEHLTSIFKEHEALDARKLA